MKKEKISVAVGNIESRYIEEAELYSADKKRGKALKLSWGRVAAAAAAVACIVGIGIPVVANTIGGYYKDIIRFDGAVVGGSYENATEEISIEISGAKAEDGKTVLSLDITLVEMGRKEPYIYLKGGEMTLGDFKILDSGGREVYSAKGAGEESASIEDGKAAISYEIEPSVLSDGEKYTMVIESVYGLQKAEQPLRMSGFWEIDFVFGDTVFPLKSIPTG